MAGKTEQKGKGPKRPKRRSGEVVVQKRATKGQKPDTVRVQWSDGAGELNYDELSPAQSWPFLREDQE